MSTVGIRDLKNQLSRYLEEVERGERIGVTRRGKVIAYLVPAKESHSSERLVEMVREGLAAWAGGTPTGSRKPIHTRGKPISQVILEGRD